MTEYVNLEIVEDDSDDGIMDADVEIMSQIAQHWTTALGFELGAADVIRCLILSAVALEDYDAIAGYTETLGKL